MPNQANAKGLLLERAVAVLENAILKMDPALAEGAFTTHSRKIINVGGVNHEIDFLVEVKLGNGYGATYIFETKNLKKPVSKNDIIVLSEKIKVTAAQRGFFVAKSFSKHARAQAATDPRIVLLDATEEFAVSELISNFHHIHRDADKSVAHIRFRAAAENDKSKELPLNIVDAAVTFNGASFDMQAHVQEEIKRLTEEDVSRFNSLLSPDGVYQRSFDHTEVFEEGALIVNELAIKEINYHVDYPLEVVRPPIVSKFEIRTRGRVYTFGRVTLGQHGWIEITMSEYDRDIDKT